MSVELGRVFKVMPIPAVESDTEYFESSGLRIGVETRHVDGDLISREFHDAPPELRAEAEEFKPESPDGGVTLHVYSVATGLELLRFDCFEREPHYHYIDWDGASHLFVPFDSTANGDPVEWALDRIRTRLPEMLGRVGAADLATAIAPDDLAMLLTQVSDACAHQMSR